LHGAKTYNTFLLPREIITAAINVRGVSTKKYYIHIYGSFYSLLTDIVVLTPSDEILPSAYPSCIFNSLCFRSQSSGSVQFTVYIQK
jgi:hypothetical protein